MLLVGLLILVPLVAAIMLFIVHQNTMRNAIVWAGAIATAVLSIAFAILHMGTPTVLLPFSSPIVDYIGTAIGILIAAVIVYFAVRYRNPLALVLAIIQVVGSLIFEFGFAHGVHEPFGLYYDSLSLLMALIIGIIGSGICVYAIGYMEDFQHHEPEGAPDRRPFFFGLLFLFLSAMYVIVFSNNMIWMFTGWEITTVCSFLLIGYTRTEEAIANSFRQIIMNLLGGIGFLIALYICVIQIGTISFQAFLDFGVQYPFLVAFPVALLAFAGITKAAQMPFHTWLLGAMVAPTPTSALLHSSTMVKAGVFMLVKLAPVLAVCIVPQVMVILIGGLTFLICSCMAISQSNAKRVLAYSTIANLGLITACAGVGTPEAVWAAMFLILFHAIAKSLLFLCVGTAEHHIGSRDIEDMDQLFQRMPRLARYMMLGIMCMFIAPFGMLLSKWATLVSFADGGHIVLLIILAFGSAATFMFWAKWIGKLAGIAAHPDNVELTVHKSEWTATTLMVVLIVLCCFFMPLISFGIVEPYLTSVYGYAVSALTIDNMAIASIAVVFVVIILFGGLGKGKAKKANVYLAGVSVDNAERVYMNSLSQPQEATMRNWYMDGLFGEARVDAPSTALTAAIIIICLILTAVFVPIPVWL